MLVLATEVSDPQIPVLPEFQPGHRSYTINEGDPNLRNGRTINTEWQVLNRSLNQLPRGF